MFFYYEIDVALVENTALVGKSSYLKGNLRFISIQGGRLHPNTQNSCRMARRTTR